MELFAPAKVNLYLHVGPARADGRHDLDSLVVFAGPEAADRLSLKPAEAFSLHVTGETAQAAGAGEDNLVARAVRAIEAASGRSLNFAIDLEKRLPVAAGLGGGSADAGAVLRALEDISGLSKARLLELAADLGGDVPAAFLNQPSLMRGDGERVAPVSGLPPVAALIVNPGAACPTGPVFRRYDERGGGKGFSEIEPPAFSSSAALIDWLADETRNDLEASAVDLVPEIAGVMETLAALPGARLARMSGSGASCFALFETQGEAEDAARYLEAQKPGWWARATQLGEGA